MNKPGAWLCTRRHKKIQIMQQVIIQIEALEDKLKTIKDRAKKAQIEQNEKPGLQAAYISHVVTELETLWEQDRIETILQAAERYADNYTAATGQTVRTKYPKPKK